MSAKARRDPRWRTPHVALMVQGVGASLFLVFGLVGSTVEEAYLILVDTTIIVYFIPYLYLFAAVPRLRKTGRSTGDPRIPGGSLGLSLVVLAGFGTTLVSIVLASLPGEDAGLGFFAKVVGGAVGLMLVGLGFYVHAIRRNAVSPSPQGVDS